ncbi:MAG: hypothetical protein LBL46_00370 [Rickettsiales bacterium]|nr:hypothetical protein [Rickettsiales bacterium]
MRPTKIDKLENAIDSFASLALIYYSNIVADEIMSARFDNREVAAAYVRVCGAWVAAGENDPDGLYEKIHDAVREKLLP